MKTLTIRNLRFVDANPKICISIIEHTQDDIVQQAKKIKQTSADCIEWRCDYFNKSHEINTVLDTLKQLRQICGDTPLIFTYRTIEEGGQKAITQNDYENLLLCASQSHFADIIDVEFQKSTFSLIQRIQQHAPVIVSYHNFQETPSQEYMLDLLRQMNERQGDFVKIAVMPHNEQDVENLLETTRYVNKKMRMIAISMGELGKRSRLSKDTYLTFASLDHASAPGQIPIDEMILKLQKND